MSGHQQKELHREPPKCETMRLMAAGTLGAAFLGLSSLTFAGTVMFLVIATPFLVMASPILVPAVAIQVLMTAGFLFSGGCGMGALAAMFWLYRNACGRPLLGTDQLDFVRMRIANKAWDMKEKVKDYGQYVQNKAQETPQA